MELESSALVGVLPMADAASLKRAALLVDHVLVEYRLAPNAIVLELGGQPVTIGDPEMHHSFSADWEWLCDQGFILSMPRTLSIDPESYERYAAALNSANSTKCFAPDLLALATSIAYTAATGIDSLPLWLNPGRPVLRQSGGRDTVLCATLKRFPVPDDSVGWEQLLEFRSDCEARAARNRLRRWARVFSHERGAVTESEVVEELQYLLDEYEAFMRVHNVKYRLGSLETIIRGGLEVFENAPRVRPSKGLIALFALSKGRIATAAAELVAPGREVAYVQRVRNEYGEAGRV